MTFEDTKILQLNQNQKSDKEPFFIYLFFIYLLTKGKQES